jgi:hypothetical protein
VATHNEGLVERFTHYPRLHLENGLVQKVW